MFEKFVMLFLYFFIYSILGWIMEVIRVFIDTKKLEKRGFLISPCCPIYGCGALIITYVFKFCLNNPFELFVLSVIFCSVLEYFTSYFLEKLFGARWWDYTDKKFNLNGRICLINSLLFGVISSAIVYFINPLIKYLLNLIPIDILNSIAIVTFFIFMCDSIISCFIMVKIKSLNLKKKNDNTSEITKKVDEILNGSECSKKVE